MRGVLYLFLDLPESGYCLLIGDGQTDNLAPCLGKLFNLMNSCRDIPCVSVCHGLDSYGCITPYGDVANMDLTGFFRSSLRGMGVFSNVRFS